MAIREASFLGHDSTPPAGGRVPWVCQWSGPPESPKPRLLDRVRHAIETRRYSRGTEKAYVPLDQALRLLPRQAPPRRDGCRP